MGFVFRLVPPRSDFASTMSEAERATMIEHVGYWTNQMALGHVVAFGPVDAPAGPGGIGIILAANETEAKALCDADPAVRSDHGLRSDISPMARLVTPTGLYEAASA